MTLSSRIEVLFSLVGCAAAIELFLYANAFELTGATFCYGLVLLSIVVFLFWLNFRKRTSPKPKWLKILTNFILVVVSAIFLFYVVGIAMWYK